MSDRATETTTIAASPDAVLAILLDFPRYPEWAKDLKSVEVLSEDEQGRATEVRFRAAGMGRSTNYTLRYDHSEPGVLAWVLSEGDIMRKLDGRYALTEAPRAPRSTTSSRSSCWCRSPGSSSAGRRERSCTRPSPS